MKSSFLPLFLVPFLSSCGAEDAILKYSGRFFQIDTPILILEMNSTGADLCASVDQFQSYSQNIKPFRADGSVIDRLMLSDKYFRNYKGVDVAGGVYVFSKNVPQKIHVDLSNYTDHLDIINKVDISVAYTQCTDLFQEEEPPRKRAILSIKKSMDNTKIY